MDAISAIPVTGSYIGTLQVRDMWDPNITMGARVGAVKRGYADLDAAIAAGKRISDGKAGAVALFEDAGRFFLHHLRTPNSSTGAGGGRNWYPGRLGGTTAIFTTPTFRGVIDDGFVAIAGKDVVARMKMHGKSAAVSLARQSVQSSNYRWSQGDRP